MLPDVDVSLPISEDGENEPISKMFKVGLGSQTWGRGGRGWRRSIPARVDQDTIKTDGPVCAVDSVLS